jgi:hypothetical protein
MRGNPLHLDKFLPWIGATNDAPQPANVRMLRAS